MCGVAQNIFSTRQTALSSFDKMQLIFTQILHSHRADFTENRYNNGSTTSTLRCYPRQYHKERSGDFARHLLANFRHISQNAREYSKYSLRFLFHLTINLTTHLSHNLCAVLPQKNAPVFTIRKSSRNLWIFFRHYLAGRSGVLPVRHERHVLRSGETRRRQAGNRSEKDDFQQVQEPAARHGHHHCHSVLLRPDRHAGRARPFRHHGD